MTAISCGYITMLVHSFCCLILGFKVSSTTTMPVANGDDHTQSFLLSLLLYSS